MNKVYRCYNEKRSGFDIEAKGVLHDLRTNLGIDSLADVRIFCRYDVEGVDDAVYQRLRTNVFSEVQCDHCYGEQMPAFDGSPRILGIEPLPGQYDQRADSCAQCVQLLINMERPIVKTAKVYVLSGSLTDAQFAAIRDYLINPVETREASGDKPLTLKETFAPPEDVENVEGLISCSDDKLEGILSDYALAMDLDDLKFLRGYFRDKEMRDPTLTELRMIDTYWSDHCRHTTFATELDHITIEDKTVNAAFDAYLKARHEVYGDADKQRPITLMDVATSAVKVLKKRGVLKNLDESEEINACSVKIDVTVDGEKQPWLLMFKNETHNHPTEIEPFGGAATCLGGAIRDPLSGRSYVYQAMRVTGAGDPTVSLSETLPGKLSQRKICTQAAAGYSSYGNQIGLATGMVHEFYHPGYVAKRMEIGAVVGAAPSENVIRLVPEEGDAVILVGGRTGRDGCGGATGSSKIHTGESLATCGSEVQKGNPPEERKIQRLFRNPDVARMIKRCNDFGAGGVSVAIGELADGLFIELDKVPKKYEGLSGTELAISESQERMAVVVASDDAETFIKEAQKENLEATIVAHVTGDSRLKMQFNGRFIVDIARDFLNSNGAPKHVDAAVPKLAPFDQNLLDQPHAFDLKKDTLDLLKKLNIATGRGLIERFDSSIGAGSVLLPFGGKNRLTPTQVMAAKIPVLNGETTTASVMSFGFDPYASEQNPYLGAQSAVVESVARLVAAGCDPDHIYLTFQEYFERLNRDPERFGKPLSALLGAFTAQIALGTAAIGGKDSMSGTFNELNVPPTLVSFAISAQDTSNILSPEFKESGHPVYFFPAKQLADGSIDFEAFNKTLHRLFKAAKDKTAVSMWSCAMGGIIEGICKMAIGNSIGFSFDESVDLKSLFVKNYGGIIAECVNPVEGGLLLGYTSEEAKITANGYEIALSDIVSALSGTLEKVYPTAVSEPDKAVKKISYPERYIIKPAMKFAKPRVVIPVFPGTNCEYDTSRAVTRAGGAADVVVLNNLTSAGLSDSAARLRSAIENSQIIIIPGGFSGGDEPDGSGKFIAAFFRNPAIADAVHSLLYQRDGLILGICNGFQALIKLGLVPFGEIRELDASCPTLTYNTIGRHQARYVNTRVASVKSPWLSKCRIGDLHSIAISHGEGRFVASDDVLNALEQNGQIAFQYADSDGNPSMDTFVNPNGSFYAIEGITNANGRILGKMGHSERYAPDIARNIHGEKYQPIFEGGISYFE